MVFLRFIRRVPLVYSLCAITCALLFSQEWLIQDKDRFGCRALTSTGAWTSSSIDHHGKLRDQHKWETSGCRFSYYKLPDIEECLSSRRVIFAGDSTIRQVFWAAAAELNPEEAQARVEKAEKHSNQRFEARGITLLYIWDPWMNGTELQAELDMFHDSPSGPTHSNERAALLLAGPPAFWAAAFGGDEYAAIFMEGVNRLQNVISQPLEHSIIRRSDRSIDRILVSPVLYPAYADLNAERAASMTPEKLRHLNTLLAQSSPELNSQVLWSYNSLTSDLVGAHDAMGVHVSSAIARHQFQIALNTRCNNQAAAQKWPPKGTCCVAPPQPTWTQHLVIPGLALAFCARLPFLRTYLPWSPVHRAIGHITFTLFWAWLADRSGIFTTVERSFDPRVFPTLCLAWIAVSTLFRKTSVPPAQSPAAAAPLARAQSDELKGLMQGVILLYHYTHASRILPVYKVVRLLIAMYFFLSAYGQSTYILRDSWNHHHHHHHRGSDDVTPDSLTLRHVAAVLFRLNALSALLPLAMGTTNYFSYYFAPCISFWFIVTWVTLRVKPQWNFGFVTLSVKVAVSLLLSNLFITTVGPLEYASRASDWALGLNWSAREMRFRLSLDQFVTFSGILVAFWNFHKARPGVNHESKTPVKRSNANGSDHSAHVNEAQISASGDGKLPRWLIFSSLFTVIVYLHIFALPQPFGRGDEYTKYGYNALHPYISPVVTLALVILRNATPSLRSSYLWLPAALGKISLETYVLQYHIWLANDATSLLSLGLVDRYNGLFSEVALSQPPAKTVIRGFEACVLTAVFVTLAHVARRATQVLGGWLFGRTKVKV
ncbi:10 TM acyl transferase domain found in Cas1p-domain-containing protein [Xylariomycetidae sp. FL2044]|nr:10 TM acyl transferase domain found in Cas1p-domain-containing protein [Xylariomycetidae sp. FL2044]